MKRGPAMMARAPRGAEAPRYCFCWLLVPCEDDGWEAPLAPVVLPDELVPELLWPEPRELPLVPEAEEPFVDEAPVDPPLMPEAEPLVLPDAPLVLEPEALATWSRPGTSALADFACWMAAWVRGPMMPSTGPGSKPLSFSACCNWRTDSSPCDAPPEADALLEPLVPLALAPLPLALEPLVPLAFEPLALEPLVPLAELDAMLPDWPEEAEAEGEAEVEDWLAEAEAAGWLAEAEVEGWFDEAEVCLSVPAAITEPAAINAATRASFLNCMVDFLSYGQLTAIRFVAAEAAKFQGAAAPCDARHSGMPHGCAAT
jgi:hypothetical protein